MARLHTVASAFWREIKNLLSFQSINAMQSTITHKQVSVLSHGLALVCMQPRLYSAVVPVAIRSLASHVHHVVTTVRRRPILSARSGL
jgi:hypothetical protein